MKDSQVCTRNDEGSDFSIVKSETLLNDQALLSSSAEHLWGGYIIAPFCRQPLCGTGWVPLLNSE